MATRRRRTRRLKKPLELFAGSPEITPKMQAAFDEAVRKYMQRPAVTGIDVGFKFVDGVRQKRLAIRIHVLEKFGARVLRAADRFPRTINGVPVDVIEGAYEPMQNAAAVQGPAATLRPGISIGRLGSSTGTLGLFVSDARHPARRGFLSAGHVLFDTGGGPNDPIVQPGHSDGGTAADEVARNARVFRPSDTAFAYHTSAKPFQQIVAISGVALTAPRPPVLGEVLEKCGRSTQVTSGFVDGIGHFMGVRDSFHLIGLDDNPIVDFGDSGAPWYDPATGAVVGLHCKGPMTFTPSANFAIAAQLVIVMKRIEVTLL